MLAAGLMPTIQLRLVNVGAASEAHAGGNLGYPVCLVCGRSRSPLAAQTDLDDRGSGDIANTNEHTRAAIVGISDEAR